MHTYNMRACQVYVRVYTCVRYINVHVRVHGTSCIHLKEPNRTSRENAIL